MGTASGKQADPFYIRRAQHAGSWYQEEAEDLAGILQSYLDDSAVINTITATGSCTERSSHQNLRALIVPHAGYSYSGPTAAYAYSALQQELSRECSPIRRIIVLHPSHHIFMPQQCAISNASVLQTPLGNLKVDNVLRNEILALNEQANTKHKFTLMTNSEDENEHSGEMQYPYIAHCLRGRDVTVTPVMCGSLSTESEITFGSLLSEIIHRPDVLTIVSTDFCHWGRRFNYQPVPDKNIPIHEFIQHMDRRGMDLIAAQEPGAFASYLAESRNTICGRHAVAVWLRAVAIGHHHDLSVCFVKYAQSSSCKSLSDSSVSYAAATATCME